MSPVPHQLSVAEALFLLKPEIDSDHLLGYTFVELICLDVIKVVNSIARIHASDPAPSRVRFVARGPNFDQFTAEPHQEVILQYLRKKPQIPLMWVSRSIVKNLGEEGFKKRLLKAELIRDGIFSRQGGESLLTRKGKALKAIIEKKQDIFRDLFNADNDAKELHAGVSDLGPLLLLEPLARIWGAIFLPWTKIEVKDLVKLAELWDKPLQSEWRQTNSIFAWNGVNIPADSAVFSQIEGTLRVFQKSYKPDVEDERSFGEKTGEAILGSIGDGVVEALFNSLLSGI